MTRSENQRSVKLVAVLENALAQGLLLGYGPKEEKILVLYQEIIGDRERRQKQRALLKEIPREEIELRKVRGPFGFLSGEARPGSGIVLVRGGQEAGPAGTLGLFLRAREGGKLFFLCAGHVLSNYGAEDAGHDVYRHSSPLSASGPPRKLGVVDHIEPLIPYGRARPEYNRFDAGVVSLDSSVEWLPATTCYDAITGLASATEDMKVMKCGSQEPFFTWSYVDSISWTGLISSPRGEYGFKNQVLLSSREFRRPFAAPGDSGTIIVTDEAKAVGLLIGGSVRDGLFLVTPIQELRTYWEGRKLKEVFDKQPAVSSTPAESATWAQPGPEISIASTDANGQASAMRTIPFPPNRPERWSRPT